MKKIFVLSLLLFYCGQVVADSSEDLNHLLNSINTMEANFKQTIYDNKGNGIQTSQGHMALSRPGQFKWQVKKPIPQLIIANHAKLFVYDEDLSQLTIRNLSQSKSEAPALLLSHNNQVLGKDFAIQLLATKNSAWIWFKLTPKEKDNLFESVKLGFLNHILKEMQLQDHLGHRTQIVFSDIKINQALSNQSFQLKPPAGVDIIDETKAIKNHT